MSDFSKLALDPQELSIWERWVFLLGRITILLGLPVAVMVFYIMTWRHYSVPKASLFQFLVMIIAASWVVLAIRRRFVRSALATPASFLLSVMCFSMLFAVNLGESYEIITFKIACLVYLILIPKFFTRFQDFTLIAYIMGLLCLCVDMYGIAQYFNWPWFFRLFEGLGFSQMDGQPVSTMGNVNYTAEFLNIAVPINICMMIAYRRRAVEFLFFTFVTLLNSVVLYYLDCNASYAGFIVAIPLVLFILFYDRLIPLAVELGFIPTSLPNALRYFRYAVVGMILAFAILTVGITSFPNKILNKVATTVSWVDTDGDNVTDGSTTIIFRLQCMDSAMRGIVNSLFTGIGPGNFKVIHPLYESQLERKVLGREVLARKVHNDHLQHALKYGVFGLFGFYWIQAVTFFCIIYSLYHLRHRPKGAKLDENPVLKLPAFQRNFYFYLQLGIFGGLTTALVSCIFGHTFVIESSAVTYWLMAGVSVAIFQHLHRLNQNAAQPRYGFTPEAPLKVQELGRKVPTVVTIIVLFALVLPFGSKNTHQLLGETWLKWGMGMRDSNKYEQMFYCMNRAKKIYPYQMETYYILGRYYIDAITEFARAKGKSENERLSYLNSRELIREEDDYIRKGIACLQIDLFLNPNYKWAHNNVGVLYDRLNDINLSEAAYGRVLAIDPEQIYAHFNLGLGMVKQEKYYEAINFMETAASLEPDYVEAYRYMGSSFLIKGDVERALAAIDRLVSINLQTRLSTELSRVGGQKYSPILAHLNAGRFNEALADAQRLMNYQDPVSQTLYFQSAVELINKGQGGDLVFEALNKGSLLAPVTEPEKLNYIASLYQQIAQWKEAAKRYQQYLRIVPNDLNVRRNLANVYATINDYPSAVSVFQQVVESDESTYRDMISIARLMVGANQYSWAEVEPYLVKAIQLNADQARELIIENHNANPLIQIIDNYPQLQDLLGETYMEKYNQIKSQQ